MDSRWSPFLGLAASGKFRTRLGRIIRLLTLLATVALVKGCGDGDSPVAPSPDPPRPTTVAVSPATAELSALGATVQLTAEARDQGGNVITGAAVTWTTSVATVATVSSSGLVTAAGNGATAIAATAGEASGNATVTVAQRVSAVTVSPPAPTVVEGDTLRLRATAADANGHAVDVTGFSWSSSDSSIAAVDALGLVTGVSAGDAVISATADGETGSAGLNVARTSPTAVSVTPDTANLTALGDTVRLRAEVRDQLGRIMNGMVVSWSSGDAAVATVDTSGLVTAAGNGATAIAATAGEASGNATVTVAQRVSAVTVSPPAPTVVEGDTLRLRATAADANGHAVDVTGFSWSSSDSSIAAVDALGLVTGVSAGDAVISATADGETGSAGLNVARTSPTAVSVTPDTANLTALGDTVRLRAEVRDQLGRIMNGMVVSWSSGDAAVATVDTSGLVTAAGNGSATITASAGSVSATASVTVEQVTASLAVSPALDSLFGIADTATFAAEAADANGYEVVDAIVAWESSAPLVATVSADGLVTAVGGGGEALITASADSAASTALVILVEAVQVKVQRLDTTIVVPVSASGRSWTLGVTESRWLPEMPVASVSRREDPPGVMIEVVGPGWVRVDPSVAGRRVQGVRVQVAPTHPFVVSLTQEDWPAADIVTARGYGVDRIPLPAFRVGGESALEAFGDSAAMRFMPAPLNGGACSGDPVGEGLVEILDVQAPGPTTVGRLAGPVAALDPGESFRFGGPDSCLRLWARPSAAYVLAGVERSAIDASRRSPTPVEYGGGAPYWIEVTDRTVQPSARVQLALARQAAWQEAAERHPAPPRLHPSTYAVKSDSLEGLDTKTDKWKVGDEFEWYTNDEREGVFRVVELYPPNVVFAVFKEDLDSIWTDARAAEFDEIMNWLGSEEVQNLYKTVFGPRLPITNTKNEQMVVLYNAGSDDHSTGVMIQNIDGERTTTTVHVRDAAWGTKGWYHNLTAHELAHAWDLRNNAGFVGPWSSEGIANWFADENSRLATNVPLDANWDVDEPLRGFRLRLPWSGDFLAGYRESHPYLRFLVTGLIFDHGQSYASAVRRVVTGASEDWYGHYFVQWNQWDLRGRGPGLVERMREVVPGWDPIESRLDWMASFALDDRGGLPEYDIPFIDRAWQHFPAWETIRVGGGRIAGGQSAVGGNYYFLVDDPKGIGGSVHLQVTDGDAHLEWKLVRYR
ncbi:Ig-like domain-containing protein [Candidatus Palauibacter sp.]|uniref:Ig-like domain-containing protein n=1 Tax=Candidatus Palauibacter sp. TaxID=3101350 RepID=UPI003B5CEDC9